MKDCKTQYIPQEFLVSANVRIVGERPALRYRLVQLGHQSLARKSSKRQDGLQVAPFLKRTFVSPYLFYPTALNTAAVGQLPNDVRKAFLGLLEERLEIILPRRGRVLRGFLQGWWSGSRRGHNL